MFARELDADCPVNKNGQNFVIPKDSLVVFPAGILHKAQFIKNLIFKSN